MLDDLIIRSIIERERIEEERKNREWQPESLYLPVDDYEPLPSTDKNPEDKEERGVVIIQTRVYA